MPQKSKLLEFICAHRAQMGMSFLGFAFLSPIVWVYIGVVFGIIFAAASATSLGALLHHNRTCSCVVVDYQHH